jgi:hypothetical protein
LEELKMRIELRRFHETSLSTMGLLYIQNHIKLEFKAFTLEDPFQIKKIPGKTRISNGTYLIKLRTEGGMHQRYSKRFPEMHKGMLWLRSVPNFEYIYLHCGNDPEDTEGCPLVGTTLDSKSEKIFGSVEAYKKIYPKISEAILKNEIVHIQIRNFGEW